ncbi:MAG: hypothetical protein SVK54_08990 [candidate division WOR-3 bacterium]|nr:hypothetical protein [candidate division WOR-3 bacterium]
METPRFDFGTLLRKASDRYQWNVYLEENVPESADFRDIVMYKQMPDKPLSCNATAIYPYYSNQDLRRRTGNVIMFNIRHTPIEQAIDRISRENFLIKSFLDSEPGEKHKRILFIINRTVNPSGYIDTEPLSEKRPFHRCILFAENIALFNLRKFEDILFYHFQYSSAKVMICNNSSLDAMKQYLHRSEGLANFLFEKAFLINHIL